MTYTPTLLLHILGGTVGLVSGTAAMSFRKGSTRHVLAGKVFVVSMLTMAVFAVYLAIVRHQTNNIGGGIFTFYLILTAWLTARRKEGTAGKFGWVVLLIPVAVGIVNWYAGIEKLRSPGPPTDGVPAGMNLFLGSVMVLAAVGDVRMLLRGGIEGTARIARHLWRMCFGLFIASGSFFLGPSNRPLRFLSALGLHQHFFKTVLRQEVLLFLAVLPLLLLIFWLVRVRFAKMVQRSGYRTRAGSSALSADTVLVARNSEAFRI